MPLIGTIVPSYTRSHTNGSFLVDQGCLIQPVEEASAIHYAVTFLLK